MGKSAQEKLLFLISVFSQSPSDWLDVFSSSFPRIRGFPKRDRTIKEAVYKLLASNRLEYKKEKEKILIRLTKKSYRELADSYPFYFNYLQQWDKKIRMFVYDVSEKERKKRDALRWIFQSFHLAPLGQSLWITPHDISQPLFERLKKVGLDRYVKFLEAEIKAGNVKDLFSLEDLNKKYQDLSEILEKTIRQVRLRRTRIDIFRRCFLIYQKLLKRDPGLPGQLLPKNWYGAKVRRLFKKLQTLLR